MPYVTNVSGTTITAAWGNANVRDQVVTPFATAAARTSAVTSPVQGMLSFRADLGSNGGFEGYYTSWLPAGAQLISAQTLGSAVSTVTFSSIPQAYNSLLLVGAAQSSAAAGNVECSAQYNGDSGSNYSSITWDASQAAQNPVGASSMVQTSIPWFVTVPGTTYGNAGRVGAFSVLIPGYSQTNMQKNGLHDMVMMDGGTSYNVHKRWSNWKSTSALTSMVITCGSGNFTTNSYFALIGLP